MSEQIEAGSGRADDMLISTLRACGFFVRQMGLLEGQRPQVMGSIDNATAFFKLAVAGADAAACASQAPYAYDIRDTNGDGCLRLAKDVDPSRLIAVNVTPLYAAAMHPADAAPVDAKTMRDNEADIEIALAAMTSAGINSVFPTNMRHRINVALDAVDTARRLRTVQPSTAQGDALSQVAGEPSAREQKLAERINWNTKQWYEHVGAWENEHDQIVFGSVMALRAMLVQFQAVALYAADQRTATQQAAEDIGCLREQATAWHAVHNALTEVCPGWHNSEVPTSGTERAVTAVKALAQRAASQPNSERNSLTAAANDVLAERHRQTAVEGMTNDGDDGYKHSELPRAAAAYLLHGNHRKAPHVWPWADTWWKPKEDRWNCVRAAAMILAEIERLDRAAAKLEGGAA